MDMSPVQYTPVVVYSDKQVRGQGTEADCKAPGMQDHASHRDRIISTTCAAKVIVYPTGDQPAGPLSNPYLQH